MPQQKKSILQNKDTEHRPKKKIVMTFSIADTHSQPFSSKECTNNPTSPLNWTRRESGWEWTPMSMVLETKEAAKRGFSQIERSSQQAALRDK